MSSHTKGPYSVGVEHNLVFVSAPCGRRIAFVKRYFSDKSDELALANAEFIAAACNAWKSPASEDGNGA